MIATKSSRHVGCHSVRRAAYFVAFALGALTLPVIRAQGSAVSFDPAQTNVGFSVGSTLHTVHGTFKLKSGQIQFDPTSGKASGAIIVDATTGNSDSEGRDKKMHQQVLESQKFPEIVFTPIAIKGTIAAHGTSQVELSGVLRLRGQDHDLAMPVAVEPAAGGQLHATTKFPVPYVKWGLKNPSNFFLKVDDTVDIEIDATVLWRSNPVSH